MAILSPRLSLSTLLSIVTLGLDQCPKPLNGEEPNRETTTSHATLAIRTQRDVVFHQADGERIKADLYRPDTAEELPTIVMIHGGAWMTGDKWHVIDHAREMAEAGFVVMAINYRLAPKFKWPTQLLDCQESLRWIDENHQTWGIDRKRIGVWGYSAGAHLALMMALEQPTNLPEIRACVAGGAPCDLTFVPEDSPTLSPLLGGTRARFPERYRNASPVNLLTADDPPLFFFHGSNDLLVPFNNSLSSHRKAVDCGIPSKHFCVNDVGHLIAFIDRDARRQAIDFLKANLQPPAP